MRNKFSDDVLGEAIRDYYYSNIDHPLTVHCEGFDNDELMPSYFFRNFYSMPLLEQKALQLCKGKILDVGACAGSHALLLQNRNLDVTALELSVLCCDIMHRRGIKKVVQADVFKYNEDSFDTILLLMNGTGIAGQLTRLNDLFVHLKTLLNPGGQIFIDSSDLIFLYEDDDGYVNMDLNSDKYYGELVYQFGYKNFKGNKFPWLYVDLETIKAVLSENGLKILKVFEGKHYDYLLQITY